MKNKLIIVGAVLAVCVIIVLLLKGCTKHTAAIAEKTEQKLEQIRYVDTTTHWQDVYGNEHAQRLQAEGSLQQLKGVYQDMLTAKTKELGIKESQIQALTGFSIKHDTIMPVFHSDTTISHDTVYIRTVETITNEAKDSISLLQYLKKSGWFSKTPYIDVVDYTPGAHIENIQGFKISAGKSSWLSVGPSGALIYTGSKQFIPAAGVNLVIRVWKIPLSLSLMKAFN